MSARRLRVCIGGCLGWLILYAGLYAYTAIHAEEWEEWATILKTLIPVALAIPVALLAAGFNRRNSYLQALRDLWQKLVPAVQAAIQYTHLSAPSQSDFARTLEALSTAIEMLRGVFKNVHADDSRGLYPYENLKEIYEAVSQLGYGQSFCAAVAKQERGRITALWQEMREVMLSEFDRDVPKAPVSKYLRSEPKGALALIGAWDQLDDQEVDALIEEIYAARRRDTGQSVELEH